MEMMLEISYRCTYCAWRAYADTREAAITKHALHNPGCIGIPVEGDRQQAQCGSCGHWIHQKKGDPIPKHCPNCGHYATCETCND